MNSNLYLWQSFWTGNVFSRDRRRKEKKVQLVVIIDFVGSVWGRLIFFGPWKTPFLNIQWELEYTGYAKKHTIYCSCKGEKPFYHGNQEPKRKWHTVCRIHFPSYWHMPFLNTITIKPHCHSISKYSKTSLDSLA